MEIRELTPEELIGPLNEVERKNAPKRLYVCGDIGLVGKGPRVSVVGSRKANRESVARTCSLVRAMVGRGMTVVSGLAEGIDTAAHQTALAEGGCTLGVLGTTIDEFFPAKNRSLQERMMREQLVVSQFAVGTASQRKNFPMRNRTMALLSDATVIVEAGEKSGTLHQGWEALRLGRLLFLFESVAKNPNLSWPEKMISYGAQVLSTGNLELFLDEMPTVTREELGAL